VAFDRNSGLATTAQRVEFTVTQGTGSAVGATFDSGSGHLTLQRAVEITTYRGEDEVRIRAAHAEFDRGAHLCQLRAAELEYRNGEAEAAEARIAFRDDGSAARLEAAGGFQLTTATGGRLASPTAAMEFDEHNQPRHGRLDGGVTMDSAQPGRSAHGAAPTAELEFNAQGQLRHAHLERGVTFASEETSPEGQGGPLRVSRTWRSPEADVEFRTARSGGGNEEEPESIQGTGGVTIASESRRGNLAPVPAKMSADQVTGTFGAGSALRTLVGTGHAELEQTTGTGAIQTASGDRLEASFAPPAAAQNREQGGGRKGIVPSQVSNSRPGAPGSGSAQTGALDVESAELDGHVALFEQPVQKPGAQAQPPLRATAGKAVYEGDGEWLHLTGNARSGDGPRIVNGGLELTAEKVDLSRESGDAFAHGNVKATWTGGAPNGGKSQGSTALGGIGPAHVVANEAHLNQSTGEATFRGHARLWQQANSVSGPEIVLDQHRQTLTARTGEAGDPVRAVLLSAGAVNGHTGSGAAKSSTPSVIRVRGGDLWYSDAERRAVMHSGAAGAVVAETGTATSTSHAVELRLLPAGTESGGQAQVDRMTATGEVVLTSEGRRGSGEQLVYSGVTGDYVLTGTAATPPRMSDAGQGSVTGKALIFHSRDDSVSIEGGGDETRTETTAPEGHGK
jgi:lipopolysaccharide export system protein LptA